MSPDVSDHFFMGQIYWLIRSRPLMVLACRQRWTMKLIFIPVWAVEGCWPTIYGQQEPFVSGRSFGLPVGGRVLRSRVMTQRDYFRSRGISVLSEKQQPTSFYIKCFSSVHPSCQQFTLCPRISRVNWNGSSSRDRSNMNPRPPRISSQISRWDDDDDDSMFNVAKRFLDFFKKCSWYWNFLEIAVTYQISIFANVFSNSAMSNYFQPVILLPTPLHPSLLATQCQPHS